MDDFDVCEGPRMATTTGSVDAPSGWQGGSDQFWPVAPFTVALALAPQTQLVADIYTEATGTDSNFSEP